MYLSCHTQEEIAESVGVSQPQAVEEIKSLSEMENLPKLIKDTALFENTERTACHSINSKNNLVFYSYN
jgi:DNA-binding MarR family transcriptional regulator